MIRAVATVAGMAPYALADLGPAGSVSLAQNESAFPPSPGAVEAGRRAVESAVLYPDPDWRDLREAIAAAHGLAPERLLCGAGSMELIGCIVRAFAGPGDEVLAPAHGYLFVATACQQAGADYVRVPEFDYTVSTEALRAAVTNRTRIVFLCNPGNPTGTRIAVDEIVRLRRDLRNDTLLVVDQAYAEFDDQDPRPVFDLAEQGNTVVLRTFSKAYGLAGARVGWGLFPAAAAVETRKLLNPNNISSVGQAMAVAAMTDQSYMRHTVRQTAAIRDAFAARLRDAGYSIPESRTNFVLVPFADVETAREADRRLRAARLMLRGMGGYGLGHCLRATVVEARIMERAADIIVGVKGASS